MEAPIVGGLLAFAAGLCVSCINYGLNLTVLKKKPQALASMSVVRQTLSIACLVAAYLLSKVLPWEPAPLLVGAALGLTIPSVLLSLRLAKRSDELSAREEPSGKGEDLDG